MIYPVAYQTELLLFGFCSVFNHMCFCRYHDMPDVIDFLVLRQQFDNARKRQWSIGRLLLLSRLRINMDVIYQGRVLTFFIIYA